MRAWGVIGHSETGRGRQYVRGHLGGVLSRDAVQGLQQQMPLHVLGAAIEDGFAAEEVPEQVKGILGEGGLVRRDVGRELESGKLPVRGKIQDDV